MENMGSEICEYLYLESLAPGKFGSNSKGVVFTFMLQSEF